MRARPHPLSLFWHGIFDNKKYPVTFYTPESRHALALDVRGHPSPRVRELWELIDVYLLAHNERILLGEWPGASPLAPIERELREFLHLLYSNQPPVSFWRQFVRRHHLHPLPVSKFWDYFEDFQPHRLPLADWLASQAKGKILDLGSGAHSYIKVDAAADSSSAALRKNKNAKKKIKLNLSSARWPLTTSSFDTVLLNSVLSYLPKKELPRLFIQIRRILSPSGLLLITNAPVSPVHPARYFQKQEVRASDVKMALKKAGFHPVVDDSRGGVLMIRAARSS